MKNLKHSILQLITKTSTCLPPDVKQAILRAEAKENQETSASIALDTITRNIKDAQEKVSPICQDTGMLTFKVFCPVGVRQSHITQSIQEAICEATDLGKLRPNSVDSLTGDNTGNNLGKGSPIITYEQWDRKDIDIRLILKGGGCENKNIQYSLPCELAGLGRAGRDFDGIRKCILHSVYQAQGQGCSAGFIGVGIGGDRTSGYLLAKQQLFRKVTDTNKHPELRELEEYIMEKANLLGIGTMGFGGNSTLLGCKIAAINRIPASFFVSVAYNCWAFRRQGVLLDGESGEILKWIYGESEDPVNVNTSQSDSTNEHSKKEKTKTISLTPPITEEEIRSLKVGDIVSINGLIHTGRDALHKYLMNHDAPISLNQSIIYHCGPVALQDKNGEWKIKAAGPTTSIREEPYQADIIKKFGIRAVIGKGGMGSQTLQALKKYGAVYLNAIGGAATYYASCITNVHGVHMLKFGIPEAMWHIEVKNFMAIVTMDAHGNSLHKDIEKDSLERLSAFKDPVF